MSLKKTFTVRAGGTEEGAAYDVSTLACDAGFFRKHALLRSWSCVSRQWDSKNETQLNDIYETNRDSLKARQGQSCSRIIGLIQPQSRP